MSVEPRKVWQVIRYIDNVNSDESTQQQQEHVNTISPVGHHDEEDEDDSYTHLIEEQDIISYDSESSTSAQLMESPTATITRPAVLDLASIKHEVRSDQLQVSPRLVYVKLGDSSDHVITVNRPMVEDLSRLLGASNRYVTESGEDKAIPTGVLVNGNGASAETTTTTISVNDEELTSLTWLQDKNLIQGINLTTSKNGGGGGGVAAPLPSPSQQQQQTEIAVTNSPNCDKQKSMVTSNENGLLGSDLARGPFAEQLLGGGGGGSVSKTIAISELASKILSSTALPPNISHLLPSKGVITRNESTGTGQHPQQHIHKKYRREEHVKISKQQQQQQQQLLLTPTRSPHSGMVSPYSERSMSSRKYSDESLSYHSPGPRKQAGGGSKQKHPVNVPYNPFVHTTNKPPLSFSSLIFMAIENATEKALPVKEIYAWIVKHFPYFKTAPTGWKNSVRHNLSLNKCFQKVEKAPNMGKGSLWKVEQQYRQVLMQALTRSPYHQFAGTMDKTGGSFSDESLGPDTNNNVLMCNSSPSSSNISSTSSSLSTSPTGMEPHHHHSHNHTHNHQGALKNGKGRPFDPVLFPYLSKEISKLDSNNNALYVNYNNLSFVDSETESTGYYDHMGDSVDGAYHHHPHHHRLTNNAYNYAQYPYDGHVDNSTDNMDDVNAATAMLALKHGPKIFDGGIRNGHPVITSSPSEDHTYSAGNEDEADKLNGSVGSVNGMKCHEGDERAFIEPADIDLEEQRKKAEGVDALLNLAGFSSNTSHILMKRRASSDMMSFSNESSMDCNSSAIFSSPSPTKRSKTRYLQSPVGPMAVMR